ncbi:DUF2007 domain-containing protein [uncultured Mucilaginibacter sp.]|uniref:DUF2007 domain-containing protein n=1 Tax=uncultured Mucilaginibacter sp. TaxID=797541 RepID=UPI0025EFB454|nr:DUF2007 domain-containing protein [uncultured Mucilaginibacter sp.]
MPKEEPIVTYRTYYDPMLAHIELSRLQDSGIQCFISDENMATINPFYNTAIGGIKLRVFECDIEKCDAILGQDESASVELIEGTFVDERTVGITCPYCSSNNVRYGNATERRYGWFSTMLSVFATFISTSGVMPMLARKTWHCFNCAKDFEADKPVS